MSLSKQSLKLGSQNLALWDGLVRKAQALSKGHMFKVQDLTLCCGSQVATFCLCSLHEEQWEFTELGLRLSN